MNKMVLPANKERSSGEGVRPTDGLGEVTAVLLDALEASDLIFIARDETRARDIAQIFGVCSGPHRVFFCPGSDALPGDRAPPSPANAGQRTSALRGLKLAQAGTYDGHNALVSTGESSASLYPQPSRFDAAPPSLKCGEALVLSDLPAVIEDIGYFADERVDEPGEFAPRGNVADIYPADLEGPYRIEVADDRIAAIRRYDQISQRTLEEIDELQIGRAREPDIDGGVPLLDHLPQACVLVDQDADKRRVTFLNLVAVVAARGGSDRAFCSDERWSAALSSHPQADLAAEFAAAPLRFAEKPDPMRAFTRTAKEVLASGKLLLMGTRRELRFLVPRVRRALKLEPVEVLSWQEATTLAPGTVAQLAMPIPRGFQLLDLIVVAAADLLGSRAERDDPETAQVELDPFKTGELRRGDVVVREDHLAGVVPAEWIPDVDPRITLHASITRVTDIAGLESLEDELVDRFGQLPDGARELLAAARLRVLARLAGIARVDAGPAAIALTPRAGHEKALEASDLVRSEERYLRKGDYKQSEVRFANAEELLESLL